MRLVARRLTAAAALGLLVALLVATHAAQAAPPQVVHEQTIRLETETLETVCGDTAVFDRSGTTTFRSWAGRRTSSSGRPSTVAPTP
jgi:hypothetical protein